MTGQFVFNGDFHYLDAHPAATHADDPTWLAYSAYGDPGPPSRP